MTVLLISVETDESTGGTSTKSCSVSNLGHAMSVKQPGGELHSRWCDVNVDASTLEGIRHALRSTTESSPSILH